MQNLNSGSKHTRPRNKCGDGGFSLLEISVVLAIIAIVVGGAVAAFISSLQNRAISETQNKLRALQQALYNYRVAYNSLPCPADIQAALSSSTFGVEGLELADPESVCSGSNNFVNGKITEGMVPTKTLELPDDAAIDGWGGRIMYAVDNRFTASFVSGQLPFTVIPANDMTVRMSICDATGTAAGVCNNSKETHAAYVLISFGPNGHGAYPRNGGATRVSSGSNNADELVNCDCTSTAAVNGTPPAGVFVQKDATQDYTTPSGTNNFDDIVMYGTRSTLRTPNE